MLPLIIQSNTTKQFSKRRDSFKVGLGGMGIAPDSFPNLTNWFKAEDMTYPALFSWPDNIQPITLQGNAICAGCGIVPFNGVNVLELPLANAQQITPAAGVLCQPTMTAFFLIKMRNSIANRYSHFNDTPGAAAQFFYQNGGNFLQHAFRSDNSQTILLTSVTDFTATNYEVVCIQNDITAKTSRMIEGGNVITGANPAMNTFTCGAAVYRLTNVVTLNASWLGGLGEFFIYNDIKSNAVINSLGSYLAGKYSVTWTPI